MRRFVVEPSARLVRWELPPLAGVGDVADWLGLTLGELAWFADLRGLERQVARPLRHYDVSWVARPDERPRVLEAPKARLKAVQRKVLRELLDRVPVHDAAHGFVRGRSAVTHARGHVGRRVVLRLDVEDCFASIAAGRVFGVLRACGYSEPVAHVLTGLVTTRLAAEAWHAIPRPSDVRALRRHADLGRRLATPHLPQGAPTSPALANLVLFRLDRRLTGLAAATGATYTRYADDLVLSGGPALLAGAGRLRATIAAIAAEEGVQLNADKSNLMPSGGRQRVAGVIVNTCTNVPREEVDRLRATLHTGVVRGPAAMRLDPGVLDPSAHLLGRIAWVASVHPERGRRLRALYDRIDWSAQAAERSP